MGTFETPLFLEYLDGGSWRLERSFSYLWDRTKVAGTPLTLVSVPAGTETDFASVPRIFWNILPPYGAYGKAAVLHDYVYRTPTCPFTRAEADALFRDAMKDLGVSAVVRNVMYRGVRLFGRRAFRPRA